MRFQADSGGESGIRTLGGFTHTAFRVLHLRPLGQLSVMGLLRRPIYYTAIPAVVSRENLASGAHSHAATRSCAQNGRRAAARPRHGASPRAAYSRAARSTISIERRMKAVICSAPSYRECRDEPKKKPILSNRLFGKTAITCSPAFAVPSALQGLTSLFGLGKTR